MPSSKHSPLATAKISNPMMHWPSSAHSPTSPAELFYYAKPEPAPSARRPTGGRKRASKPMSPSGSASFRAKHRSPTHCLTEHSGSGAILRRCCDSRICSRGSRCEDAALVTAQAETRFASAKIVGKAGLGLLQGGLFGSALPFRQFIDKLVFRMHIEFPVGAFNMALSRAHRNEQQGSNFFHAMSLSE